MDTNQKPHTDRRRGRRGQGLVEFALIVPVFLFFLLLTVDFGRLLFTYIQLSNTAREAAAYAGFNPTTDDATLTTIALRRSQRAGPTWPGVDLGHLRMHGQRRSPAGVLGGGAGRVRATASRSTSMRRSPSSPP